MSAREQKQINVGMGPLLGGGVGVGVFWYVWGIYGFFWGLAYGLWWPVWIGYRLAQYLLPGVLA